jgi:hypothetical protein
VRLALEALDPFRLNCERRRQDLEGHIAIQLRIAGTIDLAL